MKKNYRIYAKINLDAIVYNMQSIEQKISKDTNIIAVIKTDAYGHGAFEIARELESRSRLFGFAVATAEEAAALRQNGIKKPLLILGYTFEEDYKDLIRKQVRMTVYSYEMARQISESAHAVGETAKIHIKIDTGMSRIGYQVTTEAAEEIAKIAGLSNLTIEGIFTHFARADEADKSYAIQQLSQFEKMISLLKERKVEIPIRHCSNSAGIAELPQADLDLVRAGIILYGLWPSEEVKKDSISLKPAMELKSRIIHLKTLEAGRSISYGGTYCLKEPRKIATIPAGYGDGYPRSLSNRGYVLIHGRKAPILGRVCMDQFMVDVTDIPDVKMLDTVTLLGEDGGSFLSMEELGRLSGRFNYEFACDIGKRVPRFYFRNKIE